MAVAALCLLLSPLALAAPEEVVACARAEWVWTDKKEYKPGEEVKIFLQNAGDRVIDGRIHLTILKYENGSWVLVYRMDLYVLLYWKPCTTVNLTWDQVDTTGKPVTLGRYRVVWTPYVNGTPIGPYTCDFDIASPTRPKIYLILVEREIYSDIYDAVETYKREIMRAYGVLAYTVPVSRHASPSGLRSYLRAVYEYYSERGCDLVGAVFIGDLPYALFELRNTQAFISRMNETYKIVFASYEVFPCDLYFMDLNGVWLDKDGNGILDTHEGDVYPEIFIGRVFPNTITRSKKVECIKNYLSKELNYIRGNIAIKPKALVYVDDDWEAFAETFADACRKAFSEVVLIREKQVTNAKDYKQRLRNYWDGWIFVHVAVHGTPNSHDFGPGGHGEGLVTSIDIDFVKPKPLFYLLFSCSNAKYTTPWYIAGQYLWCGDGLLSVSSTKVGGMLSYEYFYEPLGKGYCFGEAFKRWFAQVLKGSDKSGIMAWFYGMTIIGDPILTPAPPRASGEFIIAALYESYAPPSPRLLESVPSFEIEAESYPIDVVQGSNNSTYITLIANRPCRVELEAAPAPSGLNVEARPRSVDLTAGASARVELVFSASQSLKPSVYEVALLIKGDGTVRERTFTVVVRTPPSIARVQYAEQESETLRIELERIKSEYELLKREYENLASSYSSLQSSYRQLQSDYNALKSELEQIKRDYENLLASYQSLQSYYRQRLEGELNAWRLACLAMLGSTIAVAALAAEGWRRARAARARPGPPAR